MNNKKDAAAQIQYRIKKLEKMDETLYDDKLVGEITLERYKQKHEAFIKEISDLKDKLGGVDNDYKVKYMEGVTLIELTQVAKQQFNDANTGVDEKRDILTKLFRSIVLKDNFISVNYTKLAQAIAHKSSETRRIYGQA